MIVTPFVLAGAGGSTGVSTPLSPSGASQPDEIWVQISGLNNTDAGQVEVQFDGSGWAIAGQFVATASTPSVMVEVPAGAALKVRVNITAFNGGAHTITASMSESVFRGDSV